MNEIEEWIDVIGYDGIYEVSNQGRIKSLGRWVSNGKSERWVKEKILSLGINKDGRVSVILYNENVKTTFSVSILVYFSFNRDKSPIDRTYCVMHKDKIKHNNRLDNLELVKVSDSHSVNYKKGLLSHLDKNNKILSDRIKQLTHKTCSRCQQTKEIVCFNKVGSVCKVCRAEQKRIIYQKNKLTQITN
jgi:hypothetical protein